jgi:hypothetical protein
VNVDATEAHARDANPERPIRRPQLRALRAPQDVGVLG